MKRSGSHVVLLRSPRDDDPYEQAFRAAGFSVHSRPVLEFEFVRQQELRGRLEEWERYGGVICTSPRAVQALGEVVKEMAGAARSWTSRPAYAVGPRTAEMLRELGFRAEGEAAGDAAALAAHIAAQTHQRPLLFLCGNRRRDVLPEALRHVGVVVEELCVYETGLRTELDFAGDTVDWLAFFSPSGVRAMEEARALDWSTVRTAAIGPTTAAALRAAGRSPDAVAKEPAPEALVEAVRAAADRH